MTFTFQGLRRWCRVWGIGLLLTGCAPATDMELIRVWSHQGQEAENRAMRAIADAFNEAHADQQLKVQLTFFPDHQYTEKISIAAAANDLPDALGIDGPTLAQFVDAGLLAPLDPYFDDEELADFLPTIVAQGTINDTLYALGAFDSAMVLYYDKTRLAAANVQPPPRGTAWTWAEFVDACRALKAAGDDLGVMPLPRTGDVPAAACGSWCWAISARTPRRDAAAQWLRWVTHPEHGIQPIVAAGGAVPARRSALPFFPEYEEDPWRLFMELLEAHGRPRPQTPFYPNLTQHFAAAVRDIARGADPQTRLDRAAEAVQRIIDRQTGTTEP